MARHFDQILFEFKETAENRFPEYLAAQVEQFTRDTAHLDQPRLLSLTEYPAPPAASQ
jgi:hypothetical protein